MNLQKKINAHIEQRFSKALRGYRLALFGFKCPCSCGEPVRVNYEALSLVERQIVITGCFEAGRAEAKAIIAKHIKRKGGQGM